MSVENHKQCRPSSEVRRNNFSRKPIIEDFSVCLKLLLFLKHDFYILPPIAEQKPKNFVSEVFHLCWDFFQFECTWKNNYCTLKENNRNILACSESYLDIFQFECTRKNNYCTLKKTEISWLVRSRIGVKRKFWVIHILDYSLILTLFEPNLVWINLDVCLV